MTETQQITNHIYDQYADQIADYPHARVLDDTPGMFHNWRDVARFGLRVIVVSLAAWGMVCLICLL